ncbi:TrbC/VirB2 family protein [Boseongicola sp. H5]|uniref:TrbC/VirB2 family protein n=1 Tax=Boseongicola sp. H5 TaxID=2763261 RepID=UPI001D0A748E|nr:TrbC/VirB2 family protein [Boseongicola sp. H5]
MKPQTHFFVLCLSLFVFVAEPALAQSIDLSPIQNLLQGIVDALTGPLGVVIATLAVLGVFLSWFFNIIGSLQTFAALSANGHYGGAGGLTARY